MLLDFFFWGGFHGFSWEQRGQSPPTKCKGDYRKLKANEGRGGLKNITEPYWGEQLIVTQTK